MQQSFRSVYTASTPTLLASGKTVETLGVGQIAIVDEKTNTAVTAPTYATTKALRFYWGTPDLSNLPLMAGVPDDNIKSHLVKGKLITGWRGKKASKPQNQILTVGFSGDVSDTDTVSANVGETKYLFVKLTGPAIDKLYTTQGLVRQYEVDTTCLSASGECAVGCEAVSPQTLAEAFVKQINLDPQVNRFIKASTVLDPTPSFDTQNCYQFQVSVPDTGDDVALGVVQAQYPDNVVTRVQRLGNVSTYQIVKSTNSTPSAVSNAGLTVVPDCNTCPAGYTSSQISGFAYEILRQDAGDGTALNTLKTDYGIVGASGETASRVLYQYGQSTYIVLSTVALSAVGTDVVVSLGTTEKICVISSPTTYAWSLTDTLIKYGKTFKLTIGDDPCGTNRLAQIQAAYPDLTISLVDADGDCVHSYETTVYSDCLPNDCSVAFATWQKPQPFLGSQWTEVVVDPTATKAGIKIEVAYVNRVTGECTFDYFPFEADTIHVQASSFDPNYNSSPCSTDWVVKNIQEFKYPVGFGAAIREQERKSKSYDLRERSFNPVIREIEGYEFITKPYAYYDEYVLEYKFEYFVGGWSQKYTDTYSHSFFFETGQGKSFESAINGYIASAQIDLEPVVL